MLSALITSEVHTERSYYKRIFGIYGLEKLGFSRRCVSVGISIYSAIQERPFQPPLPQDILSGRPEQYKLVHGYMH